MRHAARRPGPAPSSCLACHGTPESSSGLRARWWTLRGRRSPRSGPLGSDCHGGTRSGACERHGCPMASDDAKLYFGRARSHRDSSPWMAAVKSVPTQRASTPSCGSPGARVPQQPHGKRWRAATWRGTCADCHGCARHPRAAIALAGVPRQGQTVVRALATPRTGRPQVADGGRAHRQSALAPERARSGVLEKEDLSADLQRLPRQNPARRRWAAATPSSAGAMAVKRALPTESESAGMRGTHEFSPYGPPDGCAACHSAPEPQAALNGVHAFSGASHAKETTAWWAELAMLSPFADACAFCHGRRAAAGPKRRRAAKERYVRSRRPARRRADRRVDGAERSTGSGACVSYRTTPWRSPGESGTDAACVRSSSGCSPSSASQDRLHLPDPAPAPRCAPPIVRCADCHASGWVAAIDRSVDDQRPRCLGGMREISHYGAGRAPGLAARRGGVETNARSPRSQAGMTIELEVMLPVFASGRSAFAAKRPRGRLRAAAPPRARALAGWLPPPWLGGPWGLRVVLIALAWKIRQMGTSDPLVAILSYSRRQTKSE